MQADKCQLFPIGLDKRAYRFFPKRQEQKSLFEKKGVRFFFYGQIEHDEYQLRKLREFHEYLDKKQKKYNKQLYHDDHVILQFLSANKYKPKDTLKAMEEHAEFQLSYVPTLKVQKLQNILKTGYYYPCGRDMHFRPILIFNLRILDQKNIDPYYDALCYTQQLVKKTMLIPGQVESWSIIYDLSELGLTDLPLTTMKKMLAKISLNYGGKLCKLWIVNAPKGISTTWKIVSTFLDDVTVQKINISKTNTEKSIFQNIHPSQIEIKYGGTQPNRTEYFPFSIPEAVIDTKRLIEDNEYEQLLKEGKLIRNEIDPLFKEKKQ